MLSYLGPTLDSNVRYFLLSDVDFGCKKEEVKISCMSLNNNNRISRVLPLIFTKEYGGQIVDT